MWTPSPFLARPFWDTRPLAKPEFFTPIVEGKPDYWWSKADRAVLLSLLDRFRPRSVLEFGPGLSTLAFVERGVGQIDTFDDDPKYFNRAAERLAPWRQVRPRDMDLSGAVATYEVAAGDFKAGYHIAEVRVTKAGVTVTSEEFLIVVNP